MTNYCWQLTDCLAPGMIYLENGQYLFKRYVSGFNSNLCSKAFEFSKAYLIEFTASRTVLADTDSDCDRCCDTTEYIDIKLENIVVKDEEPVGFYFDFGHDYRFPDDEPNAYFFNFSDRKIFYRPGGIYRYALIEKEEGKIYESFSRIY